MKPTYLEFASNLAREAGAIMRTHFGLSIARTYKEEDGTPLTIADTTINDLVITSVKQHFPAHNILGEEGSFTVSESAPTWVCDPIDGTSMYAAGIPTSTFSIALVEDGVPVLGVIYDPFCDRLFTAEKGGGAFVNGEPLHVSEKAVLPNSRIDIESRKFAELFAQFNQEKVNVAYTRCITYAAMMVACGEFDTALFLGTHPWDLAAVKIIVEEAGGKVTDRYGHEQLYDRDIRGAIVSNTHLHQTMVEMIATHVIA